MISNKRNHADVLDCRSGMKGTIGPLVERVEPGFPVSLQAENQDLHPRPWPYPSPLPDSHNHTRIHR